MLNVIDKGLPRKHGRVNVYTSMPEEVKGVEAVLTRSDGLAAAGTSRFRLTLLQSVMVYRITSVNIAHVCGLRDKDEQN